MDYFVLAAMSLEGIRLGFFFFVALLMKFLAFLLACPNQKRHVQNNLNVKKKKIQTNERIK